MVLRKTAEASLVLPFVPKLARLQIRYPEEGNVAATNLTPKIRRFCENRRTSDVQCGRWINADRARRR